MIRGDGLGTKTRVHPTLNHVSETWKTWKAVSWHTHTHIYIYIYTYRYICNHMYECSKCSYFSNTDVYRLYENTFIGIDDGLMSIFWRLKCSRLLERVQQLRIGRWLVKCRWLIWDIHRYPRNVRMVMLTWGCWLKLSIGAGGSLGVFFVCSVPGTCRSIYDRLDHGGVAFVPIVGSYVSK